MQNVNDVINLIAQNHGVNPKDIKSEMQKAINESYLNFDLFSKDNETWKNFIESGNEPNVEDFLMYISIKIMLSV